MRMRVVCSISLFCRSGLAVAVVCALGAGVFAGSSRAAEPAPIPVADVARAEGLEAPADRLAPVLEVGDIEHLDLEHLRAVIADAAPMDDRSDAEVRTLSLEESLQVALTNNLDIDISRSGIAIGEDEVAESSARFHPTLGVTGDAVGWQRDRTGGRPDETMNRARALVFVEQEVPTGGNVRLGVGYQRDASSQNMEDGTPMNYDNSNELAGLSIEVYQPLLRGGRVFVARSEIIDSEYGVEINQALLAASMLRVKAETKSAYYNVVRARRQVEVVERALARDRQLIDASNALYDAGRVSKVDVYSAEIRLATDEARIATSRAELRVRRNELRRALGLPVGIEILASEDSIPFQPVYVDLADWITRAMRNRPELLQMRAELRRAELAKRVAGNGKLPELGITGGFQPGFDWASYNWEAGIGFRMPIGNRAPRARYRQAEGARSIAQTQLYRKQREIELEVREFEIRLRENFDRIDSLSRAVESARAKREVAAGRFELGLANNLDIVNADEDLIRAESQLLTAVADYVSTVAYLESAIGGAL